MKGGCLRGAVRYEAASEPAFVAHCHCIDCQKASGAGHVTVVAVPEAAVTFSGGEMRKYATKGDSGGEAVRVFCPTCGGQLYSVTAGLPGMLLIKAGSLDESNEMKPAMAVYASSARSWDLPAAGLPSFPKMPG